MFGKPKTGVAVPTGVVNPNSGMGMMLKTMGIDPSAIEDAANTLLGSVQGVESRLAALEAQNVEILALLRARNSAPDTDAAGDHTEEA